MIFSKLPNKAVTTPEVAVLVQGMRSEKAFAVTKTGDIKMSGKFLARASALSLAALLAACGGDGDSTPLVSAGGGNTGGGTGGGTTDPGQETVISLGKGTGSSFVQGQIESNITNLPPRGTTSLKVSVVDAANGNALVTDRDVEVSFRSGCSTNGTATIVSPIITGSGVAETTYTANGCAPDDTVTASIDGAQASASIVLRIDSSDADRITSNAPEFTSIAPAGSGTSDRPSESEVSFTVVDQAGDPVPGVTVSFRITGDTASPSIPVTIDPAEATSNAAGQVSTLLIAGSDSTVVRVIAGIEKADGGVSETQSAPIAINSTIPIESGLTLAASNFIPDAQFTAGVEVEFSIFATDKNGQNVRGNTTINFTTVGGSITPECPLSEDGTCTVIWRSQSPQETKPLITATTIGELTAGGVGTISQSAELFISSSRNPTVALSQGPRTDEYCASVSVEDRNGALIHPPADTEVEFTISDGEILSAETTKTVRGSFLPDDETQFVTCVFAQRSDAATPARLTVTVTTPGDTLAEDLLNI
ncbi:MULTISPECIES: Ig-like domain-containing protein [Marinobacter]|jgi:hypothetical protein|nr:MULTISPECIES: Ig-like domain-containing protein [Marinobacter]|tara:strand:+ start:652 stop:2256 length:1605 start_codon:yes stop_codon:yes gene_type:complete